jgi:hypothetical protein
VTDVRVDITVETKECISARGAAPWCHNVAAPFVEYPIIMHDSRCPLYDAESEARFREAQRRSFAYGNAAIGNPRVTRELIASAATKATPEENQIAQARRVDAKRKAALGWFMRLLLRLAKWFIRRYTL